MPDPIKRRELIRLIRSQPEHEAGRALVKPCEFFDGNDDLGSIGCNLPRHPGLGYFRRVLEKLATTVSVDEIWLQIYDIDEGDWPFSENILAFGDVSVADIEPIATEISPSEIEEMEMEWTPTRDASLEGRRYVNMWWD